jgi:hypothetical protein
MTTAYDAPGKGAKTKYMGYSQIDYEAPFAKYFNADVAAPPPHAMKGLAESPYPVGALPPVEGIAELLQDGYREVETGYTLEPDGSLRVAVLTSMPGVSPKMWDWWFGWHGCAGNRYKLWHPKAHRSAAWQDGRNDVGYVGRVSMIEEYIGTSMEKANIRFASPAELGFPNESFADQNKAVFICARIGYTHYPLDFGWLVHQIRATPDGAEMRSRFFMGGPHIQLRWKGAVPAALSVVLQKLVRLPEQQAKDLLIHCSEEMNHLASFLPKLYAEMS